MTELASIKRCRDITDEHIAAAIGSRDDTRALLEHALSISKPREAGARVLLVFARMATSACDWLDGALRVELTREGVETFIDSYAEIGAGLKERVFPRMAFNVPFDEFVIAIQKFPQAIAPMSASTPADGKLVLAAGEAQKVVTADEPIAPPPAPLSVADLPTVNAAPREPPPKPLAKLKLERRMPALRGTVSEEIVVKPRGDSRRDATGEHPAMPVIEPPTEEEKPAAGDNDDVDKGWE